jgi:hypothetical protein
MGMGSQVWSQVIYLTAVPDKFQGVHNRFQLILEEFQAEAARKK